MFTHVDMEKQIQWMKEEEREEGRQEGFDIALINLVRKGKLTMQEAAEEAGVSVDVFEKKMAEFSGKSI